MESAGKSLALSADTLPTPRGWRRREGGVAKEQTLPDEWRSEERKDGRKDGKKERDAEEGRECKSVRLRGWSRRRLLFDSMATKKTRVPKKI